MSDPRTRLVADGYDAMIDTWEAWATQVTDDPRSGLGVEPRGAAR